MRAKRIVVPGLARLPAFCHATVAGDFIYISGTLGTLPGSMLLAPGGVAGQTTQTLRNIETILQACGAGLDDLVKVNVFLADIDGFGEMNEAYLAVMGDDPPARITVGKAGLALGPAVEIDAIAYLPQKGGRE